MAEKKITKREMFAMVINALGQTEVAQKAEMVAFLEHEIDLLERKSSKSATTKNQAENEKLMVLIKDALAELGKPVTVSELMPLVELSNQKISALLRILKERGEVVKTTDKKKSLFSLAEQLSIGRLHKCAVCFFVHFFS